MSAGTYMALLTMPCCDTLRSIPASYSYSPGMNYMPNGDPGYPPESDFELQLPEHSKEPCCPQCGHVFTEQELEDLWRAAEAQMPLDDAPDMDWPEPDDQAWPDLSEDYPEAEGI